MLAAQRLTPFVLDEVAAVGIRTRDEFDLNGVVDASVAIAGARGLTAAARGFFGRRRACGRLAGRIGAALAFFVGSGHWQRRRLFAVHRDGDDAARRTVAERLGIRVAPFGEIELIDRIETGAPA